jgi:hypothetical protein
MYVRWKKRSMTRTDRYRGRCRIGAHALAAVLVESRRVNGSPRQRFAHLGTVQVWENGYGDVSVASGGRAERMAVVRFWEQVARKLDAVQGLRDRETVETMISARVPRLDG